VTRTRVAPAIAAFFAVEASTVARAYFSAKTAGSGSTPI
jgi:hypothetical protein